MKSYSESEWLADDEKYTDMQVAMRLLTLMEGAVGFDGGEIESIYTKMAEKALETMTNPFARELLLKRIGG